MLRRRADRAGQVQLLCRAIARPAAQAFERHLDIACPKRDAVVQIAKFALVPDLDRALVAAGVLPDPHAFGVITIGAEWRCACRADPF